MKPIVYKTINKVNNKFYYGVHKGNNPYYLGSGVFLKQAIKKYGIKNFTRHTIMELNNIEEAYELEALIVDKDMISNPNCYNCLIGGSGDPNKGYSNRIKNKKYEQKDLEKYRLKLNEESRERRRKRYGWKRSEHHDPTLPHKGKNHSNWRPNSDSEIARKLSVHNSTVGIWRKKGTLKENIIKRGYKYEDIIFPE